MSTTIDKSQFTIESIYNKLRDILCDILVLNEDEVQMNSKLVDDLDADSIAFLELTFRLRSDFGLQVPQAKVDEETLTLPILEGMQKMEEIMGGTTLFEFMQTEATRDDVDERFKLLRELGSGEAARERAEQLTLGQMAQMMGTDLPQDFDPDDSLASLCMRDLFRFITVDSYVRYIEYLAESQERIEAMGGADAMNAEVTAKARAVNE